ncbi:MAG: ATP-binding cassette domain-containing protein, partial [Bradyrhizobium sp.]|nr:ATP-binding cassette domain-containing protein [Bradyrhizobium sp.]
FSLARLTEFYTRSSGERTNALANEASRFVAAALRNGEVVRGLGMGDIVMDRWSCRQSAMVDAHSTLVERGAAMHSITKFARMAVQTSLLCIGAWLAIEQQISPGAMMATSIIMGRALAPVEQVVGQWKRIIAFRSAYRRLEELFQALPVTAAPTALPAPRGDIDVENAVVWPPAAGRPSVKGVSFSLKAGESLAIVGASASGKSSMARAMAGVWPLREGVIRIDGAAYSQWDQNRLGKHIGYLPQDIELFSGTVADNIARLAKVDEAAVVAAAKAAGAHEVILRLPNGYDTPIGEGGVALSGGMRQRVGLARALYGDPRLLILDEPNSNLDEDGERALAHAMAQAKAAGRTVIVVTHRPQLLAHVDRIMVMSFGKSLAFGERDEVIARMRGQRVVVAHDRAAATAA